MRRLRNVLGLLTAIALLSTGSVGSAAQMPSKKPDRYCRFNTRVRLMNQTNEGFYPYFTGSVYWAPGDANLYRTRPGDEYCEAALISDTKGRTKINDWIRILQFTATSQQMGENFISIGRISIDSDWIISPASVACVRESTTSMPKAFTQAEVEKQAARLFECFDEPRIRNKLDVTLNQCKIFVNHFTVDRRVGRPSQAEKVSWVKNQLKALGGEISAKCPNFLNVPSCNNAREVFSCLQEANGLSGGIR